MAGKMVALAVVQRDASYSRSKRSHGMPIEPPSREDTYVINPESGTEIARLHKQDNLVTKYTGDPYPQDADPATLHQVLDLSCEPGSGILDAAVAYPKMDLMTVD